MQYYRVFSLILIHIFILFHVLGLGQNHIGSIDFQEFFHSFLKIGKINAGVILVFLALFSTLVFGRFFCGWACHFGAVQEFSWFILQKLNITPKTINSRLVVILPFFILLHFYIIPNLDYAYHNPWSIELELNKPNIWKFLPGFVIGLLTFFIDGFLIVYLLGRKGFCRFICPWGAFLKIPAALSIFKIRHNNGCIESGNCTKNCPIGIDVSYEINKYNKVVNTNCTNCMICTDGCPTKALTYSYLSPIDENLKLSDFINGENIYKDPKTKNLFLNFRSKDISFLVLVLIFGFSVDGLFGMGHFLSFGISVILSFMFFQNFSKKILNIFFKFTFSFIVIWALSIKISINKGLDYYRNGDFEKSIKYLSFVIDYYPNKIGRYYVMIADSYYEIGDLERAIKFSKIAKSINPDHQSVKQLLNKISKNIK
ncbi:MAG: 4Fe-4S binding protein [Candidatus Neomarinimicrobiota bacterium]|nr:4Fe-4S binding protein [Candidatus Neomarinimicrobiota bacterium]